MNEWMKQMYADECLAHHGVLGQKWGIRRFQPYPKGYHGDGKYVGKVSEKAKQIRNVAMLNAITIKNMAKKAVGKHRPFDTIEDVQDTKIARDFINSDEHKKAFKNYRKISTQQRKMSDLVERYDNDLINPPKLTKDQYDKAVKKLADLNVKRDKAYNELKQMGKDYADKVLGTYGGTMTASVLHTGRQTAHDILTSAISPAFLTTSKGTPVPAGSYRYDWGSKPKKPTRNDRKQTAKNVNDAFWKGMHSKEGRAIMDSDVPLQATIKRDKKYQDAVKNDTAARKKVDALLKKWDKIDTESAEWETHNKKVDDAFKEWDTAGLEVRKQSERLAKSYLGRYGKTPVAVAKTTKLPFLGGMRIPGALTAESELRDYIRNKR